jgi:hypothetical protein
MRNVEEEITEQLVLVAEDMKEIHMWQDVLEVSFYSG